MAVLELNQRSAVIYEEIWKVDGQNRVSYRDGFSVKIR